MAVKLSLLLQGSGDQKQAVASGQDAVQVALHTWKDAAAVRCSGSLQLTYNDEIALTEEVLLEPSKCSVCLEHRRSATPQVRTLLLYSMLY